MKSMSFDDAYEYDDCSLLGFLVALGFYPA